MKETIDRETKLAYVQQILAGNMRALAAAKELEAFMNPPSMPD